MGAIASFIDPIDPLAEGTLPVNNYQAAAAQQGTGPTQLNERNFQTLINQALSQQGGVNSAQDALAQSLQAQMNGTGGPNLAQQQLQNATNQNIQAQAGAVAGLRGLSPAMQARLIANQGANIQQQMAGQSAEARMQQQLAAQEQLAGVLGQQQQGNLTTLNTGVSANQAQNALNLQNLSNQQQLNQNTAAQNANLRSQANQQSLGLSEMGGKTLGSVASAVATGGAGGLTASEGTVVPGKKRFAKDDRRDDTVPALLSPEEVVVPASISDDPEAVKAFIAAINKARGKNRKGK